VLALILALMTFGKVLSPQYFIWTLPAWALVAAHDRVLAVLGGLTLLLTGIEFPRLYWDILGMHHGPLALLIARNVMLVAAFGFAAWRLWSLPEGTSAGMATKPPAAPRVSPPSMLR
jgi:hypothetical protein